MNRLVLVILSVFCVSEIFAQSATQPAVQSATQPAVKNDEQPTTQPEATQTTEVKVITLADAQKAYVAGNWKDAAAAYEQVCYTLADSARTECLLWNILALSQTSSAKDFSKAGKRLDSLIQKTSPQHPVYADLMMTKAQFQLYLGRHQKAADALIHAIETSQPHQATVLQKVCEAIQSKIKSQPLDEACKRLSEPEPPEANQTTASSEAKTAPTPAVQPATQNNQAATTNPATTDNQATQSNQAAQAVQSATAGQNAQATPATANETWYLQLGAFSKKENALALTSLLKKSNIASTIEERKSEIKTLYLVQSGNFESKEKAIDFGAKKLAPLKVEFRALPRN